MKQLDGMLAIGGRYEETENDRYGQGLAEIIGRARRSGDGTCKTMISSMLHIAIDRLCCA